MKLSPGCCRSLEIPASFFPMGQTSTRCRLRFRKDCRPDGFARGAHWCVAEGLTYAILDEIAATVVNMVGSLAVAGTPSWPDSDLAFSPVGFHLETLSRRSV